eukprot:TRINITY_DN7552_c0_g2_i1.p1 TRINITY_DN7552_c0_g2~~TRINITY_DN7552_c0_g2_i1.p1  ORF type:complete len:168 (-),score=8.95 TRINITY_DN7552_c0_g2_i1:266-694(-)
MATALATVRDFLISSDYSGVPVMVSYSPYHYEDAYGNVPKKSCKGAKYPFTPKEFALAESTSEAPEAMAAQVEVFENVTRPPAAAEPPRATFRVLDITRLSLMRPDAHLQNYTGKPGTDCSHWCNPGLPDTWSEILYNMLMA